MKYYVYYITKDDFMRRWFHWLMPKRLKHRLFAAFLLIIFIPFSLLVWWNFSKMQVVLEEQLGEQSRIQLKYVRDSFEDLRTSAFHTVLQLENETVIRDTLKSGDNYTSDYYQIRDKLNEV